MKATSSLLLLLGLYLTFTPLINCETDEFDSDEGVTVEDEIVSCKYFRDKKKVTCDIVISL